jgi:hypothetical protein
LPQIEKETISLYHGELTAKCVVDQTAKIAKAFPLLTPGFYDMLSERIKDKGFCDERLKDAVSYVIDNCPYPTPTIANFISYDRTVKFKTYDEMCKEALTSDSIWREWLAVKYPDMPKTVWVHANDVQKYNLQKYVIANG